MNHVEDDLEDGMAVIASFRARGGLWKQARILALMAVMAGLVAFPNSVSSGHAAGIASASHVKAGGQLIIDNESGALWTGNFSPFNPGVESTSVGIVYETLVYIN